VRRILVTGASGFVGGHLRPALRAAFPEARLLAATRGEAVGDWDEAVRLLTDRFPDQAELIAAYHLRWAEMIALTGVTLEG
jgi:uncharacterized protein YbjT (DUF2867 family)